MSLGRVLSVLLFAALSVPVGHSAAAEVSIAVPASQPETEMNITRVELTPQPMVYVTATASMAEMSAVMGTTFATLGRFIGTSGVTPLGPPLAIYHDWSGDRTAVDVGFPVSAADAGKAAGEVRAGMTPGGFALKAVHVGPYDDFPATYAAIGAALKAAGIPESTRMWEVYLGEPGVTPDAELITEIYTPVSAADAAKFPAK